MTVPVAFAAGIAAFFSPCVLPLLPVWLAFLGGDKSESKLRLTINLLFFVAGFSLVFTVMGASASLLGRLLLSYQTVLLRVAGVVLIVFGIQMMGLFHLPILQRKLGLNFAPRRNCLGYFLLGVVLALGWTPCIGMILASILMLAGSLETVTQGMLLLFVFSLGFAVPFFVAGLVIGPAPLSKLSRKASRYLHFSVGIVLVAMGILLILNRWTWVQSLIL